MPDNEKLERTPLEDMSWTEEIDEDIPGDDALIKSEDDDGEDDSAGSGGDDASKKSSAAGNGGEDGAAGDDVDGSGGKDTGTKAPEKGSKENEGAEGGDDDENVITLPDGVGGVIGDHIYTAQEADNVVNNAMMAVTINEARKTDPKKFWDLVTAPEEGFGAEQLSALRNAIIDEMSAQDQLTLAIEIARKEGYDVVDDLNDPVEPATKSHSNAATDPRDAKIEALEAKIDKLLAGGGGGTKTANTDVAVDSYGVPIDWKAEAYDDIKARKIVYDDDQRKDPQHPVNRAFAMAAKANFTVPLSVYLDHVMAQDVKNKRQTTKTDQRGTPPGKKNEEREEAAPAPEADDDYSWVPDPEFGQSEE